MPQAVPTGGEQAANALQPGDSSRHTTTLDAKVGSTITALLLVDGRPCVFSPGSYQRRPCGTLPLCPSSEEAPMSSEIPGDRPSDFSQPRPPDGAGYGAAPTARPRRNGMGTAALVIGVVALVLVVLILFAPLGALLGLVALALGIVELVRANRGQADNRGQAVAGLVTGALALVIGLFFAASIGAFFATNVNDFRQFGSCLDGARGDQAREACAEQLERNLDR